jgi:hypothetical protein
LYPVILFLLFLARKLPHTHSGINRDGHNLVEVSRCCGRKILGLNGEDDTRRTEGMPELAKWAAMREPMVPAPRTPTRWIGFIVGSLVRLVEGGWGKSGTDASLQEKYKEGAWGGRC